MGTETKQTRAGRLAALRSGAWDPPGRAPNEPDQPARKPERVRQARPRDAPSKPCWLESTDHRNAVPALLLDWDERDDGWWGLITTSRIDDGAVITMTRWVPADRLSDGGR